VAFDYYLTLFDIQCYRERIEPTLRDFFAGAPEEIFLPLLEETNRRASQSEPLRRRLLAHGIEPGQSIIRLLTGLDLVGPPFDDDVSILEPRASRPALEVYVSGPVAYEIIAGYCLPELPGIQPQQAIGESALVSHLIEHSAWIEGALEGDVFGKGEPLRYPLGVQSELMSRPNTERFLEELKRIPPPDPRLGNEGQVTELQNRLARITLRRGTAGILAKLFEAHAGRIIPAASGESVADRIANLKRIFEAALAESNLAILFTLQ
jgi:hypothetical protein